MNGFNPPVTPEKIVKDGWRFSIPIYQRLFVWESEQIDRLLDDLWKASKTSDSKNYYVGVITTVEQTDGNNGRVFSVVDGQQRLTFLLLFFCDCYVRGEAIELAKQFVLVDTSNTSTKSFRIGFIGRGDDENDILRYLEGKWDEIKNLNFRQFHDRMEIFIEKQNDWKERRERFVRYVYKYTSFLANELVGYSPADLNLYFEKMNSTGRQLSPLEQLKGYLTAYAADKEYASEWNDCFNFEKTRIDAKPKTNDGQDSSGGAVEVTLEKIVSWNDKVTEEPAPSQEFASFARLPMRPEVLALHALQLTLDGNSEWNGIKAKIDCSSPRQLLDSFKKALQSENLDGAKFVKEFMTTLKAYRDWIDKNIIFLRDEEETDGDEESDLSGRKYAFRSTGSGCSPCVYEKMLQLQSMLYVSSGERQEWILKAYNDNRLDNFDSLFNVLRELALAKVKDLKPDALSYSPGMDRRAFWTLDYLLWEKVYDAPRGVLRISFCDELEQEFTQEQISAIKRYRFTQNRSVEHLHPRNPQNESEEWKADQEKNRDVVRNSFGNLCMISQSMNSGLSNEPVDVKFAKVRYALQGHPLQSIKLMFMFASCGGKDSEWTPKRVVEHGCRMLKILGVDGTSIKEWEQQLAINTPVETEHNGRLPRQS